MLNNPRGDPRGMKTGLHHIETVGSNRCYRWESRQPVCKRASEYIQVLKSKDCEFDRSHHTS